MHKVLASVFLMLVATTARAQECSAIRFTPGESGAFVDGVLPAEGRDCYTLAVRKGQSVHIGVVGGSENVAVSVLGVGDARRGFDFAAPTSTVEFLVFQLMRSVSEADYSLLVKVE